MLSRLRIIYIWSHNATTSKWKMEAISCCPMKGFASWSLDKRLFFKTKTCGDLTIPGVETGSTTMKKKPSFWSKVGWEQQLKQWIMKVNFKFHSKIMIIILPTLGKQHRSGQMLALHLLLSSFQTWWNQVRHLDNQKYFEKLPLYVVVCKQIFETCMKNCLYIIFFGAHRSVDPAGCFNRSVQCREFRCRCKTTART